jgi:broad specificity phosphatase PhoE
LSTLYFLRHGQAGLRDDYDNLSGKGRRQARALGEYLASQRLPFARVIAGGLRRQQATLAEVRCAYDDAGVPFPEAELDHGWNEFDLETVNRAFAPLIASRDAEFRAQWDKLQSATRSADSPLHREWLPCDSKIVEAWIENHYEFGGESWQGFQERIGGAFARLLEDGADSNVAIFTSATPVALVLSATLGFDPRRALRLAGTSYNSSISVVDVKRAVPYLVSFNATPHLNDPDLRTLR